MVKYCEPPLREKKNKIKKKHSTTITQTSSSTIKARTTSPTISTKAHEETTTTFLEDTTQKNVEKSNVIIPIETFEKKKNARTEVHEEITEEIDTPKKKPSKGKKTAYDKEEGVFSIYKSFLKEILKP